MLVPAARRLNQQELAVPSSPLQPLPVGPSLTLAFLTCCLWHFAVLRSWGRCFPAQLLWAPGNSASRLLTGPGSLVG